MSDWDTVHRVSMARVKATNRYSMLVCLLWAPPFGIGASLLVSGQWVTGLVLVLLSAVIVAFAVTTGAKWHHARNVKRHPHHADKLAL